MYSVAACETWNILQITTIDKSLKAVQKKAQKRHVTAEKNRRPLEENCLIKNFVCLATVCSETNSSSYVGMTGNNIKTRYYNHFKSFMNNRYKNEIELSK